MLYFTALVEQENGWGEVGEYRKIPDAKRKRERYRYRREADSYLRNELSRMNIESVFLPVQLRVASTRETDSPRL